MISYEQMRALISQPDKEAIMHEVSKLSEEDAKGALIMALLAWRKSNEINEEIDKGLRNRISELEQNNNDCH